MAIVAFSFARQAVMNAFKNASNEQIDAVPEHFNNNIRWNVGHLLVVADQVLQLIPEYDHTLPNEFNDFFKPGTSPASWENSPPSVEQLIELLNGQLQAVETIFNENDPHATLATPFDLRGTKFSTINEIVGFLTYHEGLHYQTIKLLARLTK